jgi:NitT/TauT family transport system ATP-binding protein
MSNIKLKSISHHFDDLKLFDKLSLELQEKKINVLIGPSGAGKSTLLKIISGIIKPIGGSIINQPQNISYVFQEERLIEEITVYKNLLLVLQSTR